MYAITAIGILTIVLSLIMIVSPTAWSRGILSFAEKPYFHIAEIVSRLLLGGVLLFFADSTLYPLFVRGVGSVFVFAGVFLIVAGEKRHCEFAARSATFLKLFRPAGVAGVSFGVFLIYIAIA
ncbi:MAG: hypothetical protein ACT4O9_06000 [Blastocatellia bacterium]